MQRAILTMFRALDPGQRNALINSLHNARFESKLLIPDPFSFISDKLPDADFNCLLTALFLASSALLHNPSLFPKEIANAVTVVPGLDASKRVSLTGDADDGEFSSLFRIGDVEVDEDDIEDSLSDADIDPDDVEEVIIPRDDLPAGTDPNKKLKEAVAKNTEEVDYKPVVSDLIEADNLITDELPEAVTSKKKNRILKKINRKTVKANVKMSRNGSLIQKVLPPSVKLGIQAVKGIANLFKRKKFRGDTDADILKNAEFTDSLAKLSSILPHLQGIGLGDVLSMNRRFNGDPISDLNVLLDYSDAKGNDFESISNYNGDTHYVGNPALAALGSKAADKALDYAFDSLKSVDAGPRLIDAIGKATGWYASSQSVSLAKQLEAALNNNKIWQATTSEGRAFASIFSQAFDYLRPIFEKEDNVMDWEARLQQTAWKAVRAKIEASRSVNDWILKGSSYSLSEWNGNPKNKSMPRTLEQVKKQTLDLANMLWASPVSTAKTQFVFNPDNCAVFGVSSAERTARFHRLIEQIPNSLRPGSLAFTWVDATSRGFGSSTLLNLFMTEYSPVKGKALLERVVKFSERAKLAAGNYADICIKYNLNWPDLKSFLDKGIVSQLGLEKAAADFRSKAAKDRDPVDIKPTPDPVVIIKDDGKPDPIIKEKEIITDDRTIDKNVAPKTTTDSSTDERLFITPGGVVSSVNAPSDLKSLIMIGHKVFNEMGAGNFLYPAIRNPRNPFLGDTYNDDFLGSPTLLLPAAKAIFGFLKKNKMLSPKKLLDVASRIREKLRSRKAKLKPQVDKALDLGKSIFSAFKYDS